MINRAEREYRIRLTLTIFGYTAIRLSSYFVNPRPYLWWHGMLDGVAILLLIFFNLIYLLDQGE